MWGQGFPWMNICPSHFAGYHNNQCVWPARQPAPRPEQAASALPPPRLSLVTGTEVLGMGTRRRKELKLPGIPLALAVIKVDHTTRPTQPE